MQEHAPQTIQGFLKIIDVTDEKNQITLLSKKNAIHYENISEALAYSLANKSTNFIYEMHFGNGGTSVDTTGVINYLPPNVNTQNSDLFNGTFYKIVDDTDTNNTDPVRNKMEIRHVPGTIYRYIDNMFIRLWRASGSIIV